jgi:hypothetical protein
MDYIVFVYCESFINNELHLKFKHYDKYKKRFVTHSRENVVITGYFDNKSGNWTTLPLLYNSPENDNPWKVTTSEEFVTIAYESVNTNTNSEFINSITTIDLIKDKLSDIPDEYTVMEWGTVLEIE